MNVEIIAIGTELLLGDVIDTNSTFVASKLTEAGLNSYHHSKVGDNHERLRESIDYALGRSDAVICCGGLGPTQDDITRDVIAHLIGDELDLVPELAKKLTDEFQQNYRRKIPAANLRQAMKPKSATFIDERPGSAPGLICPVNVNGRWKVIYAVPGVPQEMRLMIEKSVIPDLKSRCKRAQVIKSRILRIWGLSEAEIDEKLIDRTRQLKRLDLAFLAMGEEGIKVRITASDEEEPSVIDDILEDEVQLFSQILGESVFSTCDENMEEVVIAELRKRKLTVCIAETFTGGYIADRLSRVDGSNSVFLGGIVAPSNYSLWKMLESSPSKESERNVNRQIADLLRNKFDADIGLVCVSDGNYLAPQDNVSGRHCFFVALGSDVTESRRTFLYDAESCRQFSSITLLNLLRLRLLHDVSRLEGTTEER